MEISEIIPAPIAFTLEKFGQPLEVGILALEDNVWIEKTFGAGGLEEVLKMAKTKDIRPFMTVIVRMMTKDSKKILGKFKVMDISDMGEEVEVPNLSLVDKMMLLTNEGELTAVLGSFIQSRIQASNIAMMYNENIQKKTEQEMTEKQDPLHGKTSST